MLTGAYICFFVILGPVDIYWTSLPSGNINSVECAGDVNGDGTEDCFAGSCEGTSMGVYCLNGLNGETIWHNSSIPGPFLSGCLRTAGDIDLDGTQDLAIGNGINPAITLLSGADGSIIWSALQTNPIVYIERCSGPAPGDAVVLATTNSGYGNCTFFALNGTDGSFLWNSPSSSTQDEWIKVTVGDVSGNGWSEMGYSVDRGSVMNGYVCVRDGYTGVLLHGASNCYFGTMDICDTPLPCVAVSSFGWDPVMFAEDMIIGTTVWSSNDDNLSFSNLTYVPDLSIPGYEYPEIIGWGSNLAVLLSGDTGNYYDWYVFSNNIVTLDVYQEEDTWKLAALTASTLYCPDLASISPPVEPFVCLPGTPGTDFCFLNSDLFTAPLICVGINGTGPGACAIRSTWQVENDQTVDLQLSSATHVRIVSIPSQGGISLEILSDSKVQILDLSGRRVAGDLLSAGEKSFFQLPPGVYIVIDETLGCPVGKATVLR